VILGRVMEEKEKSISIDEKGYKRKGEKEYSNAFHRQRAHYGIYLPNKEKYEHPFSYYEVHHKDGNKLNNKISNLAILTPEEHDKEHDFFNKYGLWKEQFYKRVKSLSFKFGVISPEIETIWFRVNRELIRHFKGGEAKRLAENPEIGEHEFKQILDLRLIDIAEISWKKVQEKLGHERKIRKMKTRKKRLGNKSFNNETYQEKMKRILKEHPRAYQRWTSGEEEDLLRLFEKGVRQEEIARIFKRQLGSIRSRLKKLGKIDYS